MSCNIYGFYLSHDKDGKLSKYIADTFDDKDDRRLIASRLENNKIYDWALKNNIVKNKDDFYDMNGNSFKAMLRKYADEQWPNIKRGFAKRQGTTLENWTSTSVQNKAKKYTGDIIKTKYFEKLASNTPFTKSDLLNETRKEILNEFKKRVLNWLVVEKNNGRLNAEYNAVKEINNEIAKLVHDKKFKEAKALQSEFFIRLSNIVYNNAKSNTILTNYTQLANKLFSNNGAQEWFNDTTKHPSMFQFANMFERTRVQKDLIEYDENEQDFDDTDDEGDEETRDKMAETWDNSLLKDFTKNYEGRIKLYLSSLAERTAPIVGQENNNFKTDDELGVVTYMDANYVQTQIQILGPFRDVKDFINKIEKAANTIPSLYGLGKIVNDCRKDISFANRLYVNFAKPILNKIQVTVNDGNGTVNISNRETFATSKLIYNLQSDSNQVGREEFSSEDTSKLTSIKELAGKLSKVELLDVENKTRNYIKEEVVSFIRKHFPSINRENVINYYFDNSNSATVSQLTKLIDNLVKYNSGLETALENENDYNTQYFKERKKYNEYIQSVTPDNINKDAPVYDAEVINKTARDSAIILLASQLVDIFDKAARLNSTNAEGKMASNVGKSSYITDFAKQLKIELENGKDGREVIKDFFTKKKYDITDVETNTFLFGLKDRNGNTIRKGILTRDKTGQYIIDDTSNLWKTFDVSLFDGIKNESSSTGKTYSEMTREDYLLSSILIFDSTLTFEGLTDADVKGMGNFLMRIPSDASNTYTIQLPRYSISNLYDYGNPRPINEKVEEIKSKLIDFYDEDSKINSDNVKEWWVDKVNALINNPNILKADNKLNAEQMTNLFINGNIEDVNIDTYSNKTYKGEVYVPFTYNKEGSNFVVLTKGTVAKNGTYVENLEIISIRSLDKYDENKDNGLALSLDIFGTSSYTPTDSIRPKVNNFLDANRTVVRDWLYNNGKITRNFNKNSSVFLALRNELWGELQQYVTNLNNVFEKDDDGVYRIKTNTNKLFEGFHYNGGLVENGQLTGNVFKFYKLFDDGFDVNTNMQTLIKSLNIFKEDNKGLYIDLKSNTNDLIYEVYNNGENVLTVGNDFQSNQSQIISDTLDNIVTNWLDSYIKYIGEQQEEFSEILSSEFNKVDINDWAINTALAYMTFDGIFEGSAKYYKDAQTFLKRAKETQMGGTPYAGSTFEKYDDKLQEVRDLNGEVETIKIDNFLDKIPTFEDGIIKNKPLTLRTGFRAVTIKNSKTKYSEATRIYQETYKSILDSVNDEALAKRLALDIALPFGDVKIGDTVIKGKSTKSNDAQSYITIEEFIRRKEADGSIEEYRPLLRQLLDDNIPAEDIDLTDVNVRIQAQKNVYYDLKYDEDTGQHRPRQIKNAEFVLIPKLLNKDSSLYKLYEIMRRNDIGQVNTVETSKASNREVLTFWNDDETVNPEFEASLTGKTLKDGKLIGRATYPAVEDYYYKHLYKQLDVVDHIEDKENKAGVQLFKKIQDNLTPTTKPFVDNIQQAFTANIKDSYNKLIDKLGWRIENGQLVNKEDGSTDLKYNEFYKSCLEEFQRTGADENIEDYLTPGIDGLPLMPEWMSIVSTKLENIAQSVFNNNVTRQTLPGYHGIQVTNIGFDTKLRYHPVEGDNQLPVVEIMLPAYSKDIKELIKKHGKEGAIKILEEKGLDKHIIYRIPTEGKQSVAIAKVVGFLDESWGSTIVVANEWVTQTGSDFDIDSIYALLHETNFSNGEINKIDYNIKDDVISTHNRYIDNVKELVANSRQDIQTKFEQANNDFGKILTIGKELGLDYEQFKELTPIEQLTRRQRNNFITDNVINIMSDSSVMEEVFGRSNFESLVEAKNKVEKAARVGLKNTSVYNPFDQLRFMQNAIDGRKLKAFSVNRDTFTSINNKVRTSLSEKDGIRVVYGKDYDRKLIESAYELENNDNNINIVNHCNFGWSKNNRNVVGRIITSYSSQTTAHILDAIKEGALINETDFTFGTFKTLIDLGIDYLTAIAWLAQPAISRINSINNASNSIYLNKSTKADLKAIRVIAKELGLIKTEYAKDKEIFDALKKDEDYTDLMENVFFTKGTKTAINQEALIRRLRNEDVGGKNNLTDEQKHRRDLIFDLLTAKQFSTYKSLTDKLENVSRVLRPDSFGAKQIIRDTKTVVENVEKYRDGLGNILKTKKGVNIIDAIYTDDYSAYPYLNAFYKYSTLASVKINSGMFKTEQQNFQNILKDIENKIGRNLTNEEYLKAKKYIISSVYNSIPTLLSPIKLDDSNFAIIDKESVSEEGTSYWETEKGRLYGFVETQINNPDINIANPSEEDMKIFYKLTPAQKVLFIKSHFDNIGFFDKISVTKSFRNEITNKKYSYNRIYLNDLAYDLSELRHQFADIFFNKNKLVKATAIDLVKYAFIVEGYNFRKQSVGKAIPNNVIYSKITEGGLGILDSALEQFNLLNTPIGYNISTVDNFIRANSEILVPKKISKSYKTYKNEAHDLLISDCYDAKTHLITIPKSTKYTTLLSAIGIENQDNNYVKLQFAPANKYKTYLYKIINSHYLNDIYLIPINTLESFENSEYSVNNANNEHYDYQYYLNIIKDNIKIDEETADLLTTKDEEVTVEKLQEFYGDISEMITKDTDKLIESLPRYKFSNSEDEYKIINRYKVGTDAEIDQINKFYNDIEDVLSITDSELRNNVIKNSSNVISKLLDLKGEIAKTYWIPYQDSEIKISIKRYNPKNIYAYQNGRKGNYSKDVKFYSERFGKLEPGTKLYSVNVVAEKSIDGAINEFDARDSKYDSFEDLFEDERLFGTTSESDNIASLIAKDLKFQARKGDVEAQNTLDKFTLNGINIENLHSINDKYISIYSIANRYYDKAFNTIMAEISNFELENGEVYSIDNSKLYQEANATDFARLLQLVLKANHLLQSIDFIDKLNISGEDTDTANEITLLRGYVQRLKENPALKIAMNKIFNKYLTKEYSTNPLMKTPYVDRAGNTHYMVEATDVFGDTGVLSAYISDIAHIPQKQIQIVVKAINNELSAAQYRGREDVVAFEKWIKDNIGENPNSVFEKIIDEDGRLIRPYTDTYLEDRSKFVQELNDIENRFGKDSVQYFEKKLAYDKWKLRNTEQEIEDDYYEQRINLREYTYNIAGETFVEYLGLQRKLYNDLADDDILSEEQKEEKQNIMKRMSQITRNYDEEGNEKEGRDLAIADAIGDYNNQIRLLNHEYFDYEESEDFNKKLKYNLSIIQRYDKKHNSESLSQKLENQEYKIAYDWLQSNTTYRLNKEAWDKLDNAYKILRLGSVRRRNNTKVEKIYAEKQKNKQLKDIYGTVIGTNFTEDEIKTIRDEEALRYSPVEGSIGAEVHSDDGLYKNTPEHHILTKEFWVNYFVSSEEKRPEIIEEKKRIYTRINEIIAKGINHNNGIIEARRLFDNCTQEELDELGGLYRSLRALSKLRTKKTTKKGKKLFEQKFDDVAFSKQYALYNSLNKNEKWLFEQIFCEVNDEGEVVELEDGTLKPNSYIYGYVDLTEDAIKEHPEFIDTKKEEAIQLLKENEEFVTTKYYDEALDRNIREAQELYDNAIAEGKSSKFASTLKQQHINNWYYNNHIWNKYTNTYQPIQIWTERRIKESGSLSGEYTYEPIGDNIERTIKDEKRNANYSKFGQNYKVSGSYTNSKYSSILSYTSSKEYKLYNYIENLLYSSVNNNSSRRFIANGYVPRSYKVEPDAKWIGKQVLGAFGLNGRNYKNKRWNDQVGFYNDYDIVNPMLEILKAKGYEELETIPQQEFGQSDEDYKRITDEINARNKERKARNLELEKSVRDNDWYTVFKNYVYSAEQYKARENVKDLAYITLDDLRTRKGYRINNFGKISRTKLGTESNPDYMMVDQRQNADVFENWVRRILFDEFKKPHKLRGFADTLQNLASTKYMMFNLYGGINNVTVGAANILGERFAKDYFGNKEWLDASKEYGANMLAFMRDMFSETSNNRTSAILKSFNAVELDRMLEFTGNDFKLSKFAEHFNTIAYSMQSGGEHYMQNTALIAILKSHRIFTDLNTGKTTVGNFNEYTSNLELAALKRVISGNEYLTTKLNQLIAKGRQDKQIEYEYDKLKRNIIRDFFNTIEDKTQRRTLEEKYISLRNEMTKNDKEEFEKLPNVWDQFEVVNGIAKFKEGSGLDDSHFGIMRDRAIYINKKIHGVYDKIGAAQIEKYWWGSLVMQFKKHIYPGIMKRWRTKGYYNELRGSYEKGSYISLLDFISTEFKDFKSKAQQEDGEVTAIGAIRTTFECIIDTITNFKFNYNLLPRWEQNNIRRSLADLCGTMASLLTVFAIYAIWDEDDVKDNTFLNSTLYLADRLYGESRMYTPWGAIPEISTQWSQPVAGKGVIEDLITAMQFTTKWMFDPTYDPIYKQGPYKGQNKVVVKIKKNIPAIRTIQRIQTINKSNKYYRINDNSSNQKIVKNIAIEMRK